MTAVRIFSLVHHRQPLLSSGQKMDPSTSTSTTNGGGPSSAAAQAQAAQLAKLLKDPSKPAYIPSGPKEKSIRPPQEMMKNVMGSSAGAGSGEFHVYKQSRRREYERLRLMDEQDAKVRSIPPFQVLASTTDALSLTGESPDRGRSASSSHRRRDRGQNSQEPRQTTKAQRPRQTACSGIQARYDFTSRAGRCARARVQEA